MLNQSTCQPLVDSNKCSHLFCSPFFPSKMPSTLSMDSSTSLPLPHILSRDLEFLRLGSKSHYFFFRCCAYKTQTYKVIINNPNRDSLVKTKQNKKPYDYSFILFPLFDSSPPSTTDLGMLPFPLKRWISEDWLSLPMGHEPRTSECKAGIANHDTMEPPPIAPLKPMLSLIGSL